MEAVQLPGPQGFWQHQALSGVGGWGGRRYSAPEGTAACSGQYAPGFSPGGPPDRGAWRTSLQDRRAGRHQSEPARVDTAFPVAAPPVRAGVKAAPLLGLWGPWGAGGAGPRTTSPRELWPGQRRCPSPLAGGQKASLAGLSPQRSRQPLRALLASGPSLLLGLSGAEGHPRPTLGSCPEDGTSGTWGALGGVLPRDSVPQAFDGPASLCPAAEAGVGREATETAPPATCHSAVSPGFRGCPAFLRGHFPPESAPSYPSIRLSTVNSSPRPGWLHSPSTPAPCRCAFQGIYVALWGVYG